MTPAIVLALLAAGEPTQLRRLTSWEYDNTIRDLFHRDIDPAAVVGFPSDDRTAGFSTVAQGQVASPLLAGKHWLAAEVVATEALKDLAAHVPCDPARGDRRCAERFIATWGRRAWRRPLATDEQAALGRLFDDGRRAAGFPEGIRRVIHAALVAPPFLFLGAPLPGSWGRASRLSYLLWGSMPDDELFAAAESGQIETAPQVERQARRMLDDPRTHKQVIRFYDHWLELSRFERTQKHPTVFRAFKNQIFPALLREQMTTFLGAVTWKHGGTLSDLLTAPFVTLNDRLATLYRVQDVEGSAFSEVAIDPSRGGGILAQPSFLMTFAKPDQTDVVERGKFVRGKMLCETLPPPPDDIPPAPKLDRVSTARDRSEEHLLSGVCGRCHRMMDPIGLAFENYDSLGRWQETENGARIDVSGQIHLPSLDFPDDARLAEPFEGLAALSSKLAASTRVRHCFTLQWFRFSYGRIETAADARSVSQLERLLVHGKLTELLVALTQTDAFMDMDRQRRTD